MLTFDNWLKEKVKVSFDENSKYERYFTDYDNYRATYPLTFSFFVAWSFLNNHPIFKGRFQECIQIDAVEKLNLVYINVKFNGIKRTDLMAWGNTFEVAIQQLAELILGNYGEYTREESILSRLELFLGHEQAKSLIEKLKNKRIKRHKSGL